MADEPNSQVVETEQRQGRWIVLTTGLGVVTTFAGLIIQSSGLDPDSDNDADRLLDRVDNFSSIITGSILSGIGYLLLAATVFFLFSAAARRTEQVRTSLRPLIIIGPLLLAVSGILTAIAYDSAASDFVSVMPTSGDAAEDRASDLISNSSLLTFGAFMGLAGLAAFAFGIIYSAMWGMRTGLLTRFWGTLGMAFGAA